MSFKGELWIWEHSERALGTQREHFAHTTPCSSQYEWQGILLTFIFSEFLSQVFCPSTYWHRYSHMPICNGKLYLLLTPTRKVSTMHSYKVSTCGEGISYHNAFMLHLCFMSNPAPSNPSRLSNVYLLHTVLPNYPFLLNQPGAGSVCSLLTNA